LVLAEQAEFLLAERSVVLAPIQYLQESLLMVAVAVVLITLVFLAALALADPTQIKQVEQQHKETLAEQSDTEMLAAPGTQTTLLSLTRVAAAERELQVLPGQSRRMMAETVCRRGRCGQLSQAQVKVATTLVAEAVVADRQTIWVVEDAAVVALVETETLLLLLALL
jgi:hypothetical protein